MVYANIGLLCWQQLNYSTTRQLANPIARWQSLREFFRSSMMASSHEMEEQGTALPH